MFVIVSDKILFYYLLKLINNNCKKLIKIFAIKILMSKMHNFYLINLKLRMII